MIISFKAVSVLVLAAVTTASVAQTPARSTDVAKGDDAPKVALLRRHSGPVCDAICFAKITDHLMRLAVRCEQFGGSKSSARTCSRCPRGPCLRR